MLTVNVHNHITLFMSKAGRVDIGIAHIVTLNRTDLDAPAEDL